MPNSVEKTMLILKALSGSREKPMSLELISDITKINKSTACHILKVLCRDGYVTRASHTLGYLLGPELYMLTRYGRYGEDIISHCHPLLEYVHGKYGGTAVFALLGEGKKYIIDRACDSFIYGDRDASILDDDVYRTVTGRVLLAAMPFDKALEYYEKSGKPKDGEWKGAETREGFIRTISKIRELDYYSNLTQNGNFYWLSFACPVYKFGRCLGALGLANRYDDISELPSMAEQTKRGEFLVKCRKELERRLEFK